MHGGQAGAIPHLITLGGVLWLYIFRIIHHQIYLIYSTIYADTCSYQLVFGACYFANSSWN